MTDGEPFDLQRFVEAQAPVFERVCAELEAGRKESHWMWFVFPQMKGLGMSEMSVRFAIYSLDEARAYLAHPVLGPRLRECVEAVMGVQGRGAERIFGYPDDMKFCSSMTLFARASEEGSVFASALERFFEGSEDEATVRQLGLHQ